MALDRVPGFSFNLFQFILVYFNFLSGAAPQEELKAPNVAPHFSMSSLSLKWNKKRRHGGRRVTIIIGELGFSSDLNPQKTVERKQHKYGPLIEELVREGWMGR